MICIRADMNPIIATGHIMRCLSIADEVRRRGEDILFLLADTEAVSVLEERGYSYIVLKTKWNDMESELPVLRKLIKEKQIEKLLIDSYYVTDKYLTELTAQTETVYMDDIKSFHYPVNKIICYANYWREFYEKEERNKEQVYRGQKYAPLRHEFTENPPKQIGTGIENLLLLSGGTDQFGVLESFLEAFGQEDYKRIDVICGNYYKNYENLCEKYRQAETIFLHKSVTDMKDYMEKADFAVTAGGSTLYELCAVGTPSISYSIADNQLRNVKQFDEDGIIEYAGDVRTDAVATNVRNRIGEYRENQKLRRERSKKMQILVDGKGAQRIADILL